METLIYVIIGLVVLGIVVTLYIDYQAHKRFMIFAKHFDDLTERVKRIEDKEYESMSGLVKEFGEEQEQEDIDTVFDSLQDNQEKS